MKLLARDDGLHYHKNINCGMVDMDYKIITQGEAVTRKLLACPYCYNTPNVIKSNILSVCSHHNLPIVYVLYSKDEFDDVQLHGIFTEEEIKHYRHNKHNATCLLVPINFFVKNGVDL